MVFLESSRLLFRRHEAQDEAAFVAMHTTADVRRYVGGAPWTTEKAVQRFRDDYLGRPVRICGLWATVLKSEGMFIGSCGLRASEAKDEAHLAFYIHPDYWGRGLATEAAEAFLDFAFRELQLRRVLADVEEGNAPSLKILKKFDFRFLEEEVIPATGRVIQLYELLKNDWEQRKS